MLEFLAIPAWDGRPRSLDDWTAALATSTGHAPTIDRLGPDEAWLEVAPLRLRGYAVIEGNLISAINFELHAPDAAPTIRFLESAAQFLGWEVHPDDDEDVDEDG
jgi:hypothetical protein